MHPPPNGLEILFVVPNAEVPVFDPKALVVDPNAFVVPVEPKGFVVPVEPNTLELVPLVPNPKELPVFVLVLPPPKGFVLFAELPPRLKDKEFDVPLSPKALFVVEPPPNAFVATPDCAIPPPLSSQRNSSKDLLA